MYLLKRDHVCTRMKGSRSISRLQYRHRVLVMDWSIGVEPWEELTGAIFFPRPPGFRWHFQFYFVKKETDKADVFSTSLFSPLIHIGKCRYAFGTLSGIHFTPHDGFTMASRHRQAFAYHSCIVRDCIGYNRVSIVCPSVGFVHASAQHWLFTKFVTKITQN